MLEEVCKKQGLSSEQYALQLVSLNQFYRQFYAPIIEHPFGGSAGKGWGFDKGAKILVNYPRVAGSIR